jgi:hypothetical protein
MATTAIASRSKLADRLARLQNATQNMRAAAKVAAQRSTMFVFSAVGGGGVGALDGLSKRPGSTLKLTIGTSNVRWPLLASLGIGLAGALGSSALGEQAADVALGLGSGGVAGELALSASKTMSMPPTAP